MKKFSWVVLAASVILAVLSYIVLPETVITQISFGSSDVSTMPKLLAIMLPLLLGAGGALFTVFSKGDDKGILKSFFVSLVGIVVFAIMLAVNW